MNKCKNTGVILLIWCLIGIFSLSGCNAKKFSFTIQTENIEIELTDNQQKLKARTFTEEGNNFMEEKILHPLFQKYTIPSQEKELKPHFYYTIIAGGTDEDPIYRGKIYAGSGCGVTRKFADFTLDSKSARLEIANQQGIFIPADDWLKISPNVNIFQYVCGQ